MCQPVCERKNLDFYELGYHNNRVKELDLEVGEEEVSLRSRAQWLRLATSYLLLCFLFFLSLTFYTFSFPLSFLFLLPCFSFSSITSFYHSYQMFPLLTLSTSELAFATQEIVHSLRGRQVCMCKSSVRPLCPRV